MLDHDTLGSLWIQPSATTITTATTQSSSKSIFQGARDSFRKLRFRPAETRSDASDNHKKEEDNSINDSTRPSTDVNADPNYVE